eukprot:TRINITY_DN1557_c0_g1_i1.p5 TRINITY_DN1557_c0_g1~~TRINITY_DN1557_c0_g1_i1.p5  ORF type:complete len:147 (-),score=21.54 TRINITY_DN1557_c0_g1_i1:166-606(-)
MGVKKGDQVKAVVLHCLACRKSAVDVDQTSKSHRCDFDGVYRHIAACAGTGEWTTWVGKHKNPGEIKAVARVAEEWVQANRKNAKEKAEASRGARKGAIVPVKRDDESVIAGRSLLTMPTQRKCGLCGEVGHSKSKCTLSRKRTQR